MRFLNSRGGRIRRFRRISWGNLQFFHHHGGQGGPGMGSGGPGLGPGLGPGGPGLGPGGAMAPLAPPAGYGPECRPESFIGKPEKLIIRQKEHYFEIQMAMFLFLNIQSMCKFCVTCSLPVFLPLHTHLSPTTSRFLQPDTQSSYTPDAQTISSAMPYHLSYTLNNTQKTTNPHYLLTFSDTPDTHLTSMHSVLSELCRIIEI